MITFYVKVSQINIHMEIKRITQLFLIIFLVSGIQQIAIAQWASASMSSYPKRVRNVKAIDHIKKGVLVVRLESKSNNIEKLTEAIENPDIDLRMNKQLKRQRHQMIEERDAFNKDLMLAFKNDYDFSDYVFMMDTSSVHLLDGVREGIFVNENCEIDPSISIEGKEFYIMRIGKLVGANTTRIDGLIVTDKELNDLQKPFPYYINLNNRNILKGMFSRKSNFRRSGEDIVEDIMKKFNSFHTYYMKRSYIQKLDEKTGRKRRRKWN